MRAIYYPAAYRAVAATTSAYGSPGAVLFLAMFASQAGVLVLSPILSDVASEFDVSVAEAGQLRILAAPLAALVAVAAGRALVRFSPRALLGTASVLLAAGSLASAAAPSFTFLALAQVPLWTGVALAITAGVAATAAWTAPGDRTKTVARAFAGAPAAWIVGMPVIGLVAEVDWRLAFLALPLPAAVVAGLAVLGRPRDSAIPGAGASLASLLARRDARRWVVAELFANAAWAGTLVFSGALFTEVYGTSPTETGLALALVAGSYLVGNQWAGRADAADARGAMLKSTVVAAGAVALTWAVAPTVAVTLVLFSVTAFVVATRTVAGTVYGFSVAGDLGREVGTIRAATNQIGYLVGSAVGGLALAVGGFEAVAIAFGGLFVAATLPYARLRGARRTPVVLEAAS